MTSYIHYPFSNETFPMEIAYGAQGGPEFRTEIVPLAGGGEFRNSLWSQGRLRYQVGHAVKTRAHMELLISFFRSHRGRAIGFRFRDFVDDRVERQVLAVGDGAQISVQLYKRYHYGSVFDDRIITKPVRNTVQLWHDGVMLGPEHYTVEERTGSIMFRDPLPEGAILEGSFLFDVPVRFDTDQCSAFVFAHEQYHWPDITLVELKETIA